MRSVTIALAVLLLMGVGASAQKKAGIEGVWTLTEMTTTGDNAGTRQMTQPSMYLFTKNHYSIIYVSSAAERPDVDVSKATADELRNVFVQSFVANAGTYEVKGGKIIFHPMVAKSPGYMKPTNWTAQTMTMSGDTMTLVSDSTQDGPSKNPTTMKLKRVE